ncbi:MAG: HPF/RaiA family ribosome-associated protein [Ginsengibacter sp.]
MKINLKSLKFTAKEELKEFVQEKVSKLSRFNDKIISAEVTLFLEDTKLPDNKVCEIKLVVPGNDDFVKKTAVSFEEAILSSVETMQTILQRKKERA